MREKEKQRKEIKENTTQLWEIERYTQLKYRNNDLLAGKVITENEKIDE